MPLAEASGAIVEIGAFVVEQAVAQLAQWDTLIEHMDGQFHVAINVSSSELRPELADLIADALERHDVSRDLLMLEVKEGTLAAGGRDADRSLQALHDRGIGVAVADLGTGYANWRALHEPAVRHVKVDRMLVAGCTDSIEDAATVTRLIELAHEMELEVVAEGVETQRQHDILRKAGVDHFQGWFFGRPVRAVEVEERLWSEITRRRTDLVIPA
jgi:EAL domain-containing protein (putative c-di-GMP-specific phosphodiesterase class I)